MGVCLMVGARFVLATLLVFAASSCRGTMSRLEGGKPPVKEGHFLVAVKRGDTLESIAARYQTSASAIARDNAISDPRQLRAGQMLEVVSGGGDVTPAPAALVVDSKPSSAAFSTNAIRRGLRNESSVIDDGELIPEIGSGPEEDIAWEELNPPGVNEASPDAARDNAMPWMIWPVRGKVSSHFGIRGRRLHKGIDIMAVGGTPIYAAAEGRVVHVGYQRRGYGRFVVVEHALGWRTLYSHCQRVLVSRGKTVAQGDVIALVGRTGNARGNHLHFEVRDFEGRPTDPYHVLRQDNRVSEARTRARVES
jgi:murein DD-endopeptidase MepM/ murein hydrolase activator NlpD